MKFPRSSGILLHPSSLPGRYGIGDLGEWAYRFVDWLEEAEQTLWQVLPLGPTSYGDSPYQSPCTFAGNPNLISLDRLVGEGWLSEDDLADVPDFPKFSVDYGPVIEYHNAKLELAYENFKAKGSPDRKHYFNTWCADNANWLDDYALFASLKWRNGGKAWTEWHEDEALADPDTMAQAREELADQIGLHRFRQWTFTEQWLDLKKYANDKNIALIGDIPIFVAHDSSDVWGNRHLFFLDEQGNPEVVAGVPPDYFSETGQRWGNPLYRWQVMKENGYKWWIQRLQSVFTLVDRVRIDHFRGFEAYWAVPAEEETAVKGEWIDGPKEHFFNVIKDELGELPIIAEDLGVITEGVEALRDGFNLPGMKILQFAFSDPCGDNEFLPHQYQQNCVVYTGTHDNNTTYGWWYSGEATPETQACAETYLGHEITEPHWDLMRLGMMSVADSFLAPMQDIWGYGADTRMNTPGKGEGNWTWRFGEEKFDDEVAHQRLRDLTVLYTRHHPSEEDADSEDDFTTSKA